MERILLAGNYPNLSYLELFNFKQEIILHNFTENSVFRHIFQHQITDLILHNNDEFIVVTLLRRMTHLEKLTLYLRILKRHIFDADTSPYVDGTYLQNEILVHMSQLHTFKFYISTETRINYSIFRISGDDIRQTFTNIKYGQTACIIDDFGEFGTTCHVYSLPFTFTRLEKITTHFPFTVFDTVTHLSVRDFVPFEHEFFMRISQAFPLLKCFSINNWQMQYRNCNDNSSYSVIEFTHLISLNMVYGYIHNLKCFSLTSYNVFWDTNDLIASLLRRMTHLEKLTLYLRMGKSGRLDSNTSPYVDGTYLQNEILVLMSQLHTFNFYISTQTLIDYSCSRISSNNIQQTFKNIKYEQTACIIDYFGAVGTICHVDLLPFTFTHLEMITTHFPFILFNSVTHLSVYDFIPFEHEFFMQISQAFPLLKCFFTENWRM
ncbi:unnamed protein product [Rotaria sordida]|uniref:Uncharacterized protein n=2 Tax=Rotaria sordida TaxID=392033 RepID=A0A814M6B6_9BILA|nr:unnamed protein product [Rotaria sordida]